jgi:hypothetical protein
MTSLALQSRSWNGTPIQRRTTDGYVNATAMCKANGKRWNDYWCTDRATEYLEALATETGIPVSRLCHSLRGGPQQGTWVHSRVAVDLARWLSAPFAVWMDGWFLEELEARVSHVQDTQPAAAPLPAEAMLSLLERTVTLMDRCGGADDRDQLLVKDLARNTLLRAAGGVALLPPSPDDEELTISDAWLELTKSPIDKGQAPIVGRQVACLYREEFKQDPPQRQQYVDGAPRKVFSYRRKWLIDAIGRLGLRVF